MKTSLFKATIALGFSALALSSFAHQGNDGMGDASANMPSMADGEIKAVDNANKTVTLKHGRIKSKTVEMGPMTMSFPVEKPALLANVKTGDKVRFNVENINGTPTITTLQPQK